MAFNTKSHQFSKGGHLMNKYKKELDNGDKVLAYIKNWDASHGYKYCIGHGQVRNRLILNFLKTELGYHSEELPKLNEQFEIVYQNFKRFKKFINHNHEAETLNKYT